MVSPLLLQIHSFFFFFIFFKLLFFFFWGGVVCFLFTLISCPLSKWLYCLFFCCYTVFLVILLHLIYSVDICLNLSCSFSGIYPIAKKTHKNRHILSCLSCAKCLEATSTTLCGFCSPSRRMQTEGRYNCQVRLKLAECMGEITQVSKLPHIHV